MSTFEFFLKVKDLLAGYWPWVILALARPFGFSIMFAMFAWAKLDSAILRMVFALAVALPLFAQGAPPEALDRSSFDFFAMLIKELFIGAVLGLASSIPLAIALAGGGIVDFYRGAFLGPPDPAGGMTSVYGGVFAVVTLWLFASIGGFQIITSTIYTSYGFWPVQSAFPSFDPGADAMLFLLEKILLSALILAAPLLILMFFSDIVHLISAKFGKQINVTHLAFSSKNLLAALVLPFFLVASIRFFKGELEFLSQVPQFIATFLI
jgi:type III secretion protein T